MTRNVHHSIIYGGEHILIDDKEWRLLSHLKRAWTIRELSRLSGIPYSTVSKVLERLKRFAKFKFTVNLREAGLISLHVFLPGGSAVEPPPYTLQKIDLEGRQRITMLTALIPPSLAALYLESFTEEPLAVVRGYEVHYWEPASPFSVYEEGRLKPCYSFYENPALYSAPVEVYSGNVRAPDKVDLVIISMKLADPFMRPGTVVNIAARFDPELPELSNQTLSYHTVHHVRERLWAGNAVCFCLEKFKVPRRVFYLHGRKAPMVARMIVKLPGFMYAAVDVDSAVVVGNPLCAYFEHLYRLFIDLGVELELGDLVADVKSRVNYVPMLWRNTEKRRWIWPDDPPMQASGTLFEEAEYP